MNRRSFLATFGSAAALSASAGCTRLDVAVPERTPIGELPDSIDDVSWNDLGRSEREYLFEGTAVETEYGHPIVGDGTGVVAATDFSSNEGLYPEPGEKVRMRGGLSREDWSYAGHHVIDLYDAATGGGILSGSDDIPEGDPFSVPEVIFTTEDFTDEGDPQMTINENSETVLAGNFVIRSRSNELTPWHEAEQFTWSDGTDLAPDEPVPQDTLITFDSNLEFHFYWRHPEYSTLFVL
jgi:hypothetical protein